MAGGRATVERAIAKADAVLGGVSGLVLSPGWQDHPSETKKIPVYIVDASAVAATDAEEAQKRKVGRVRACT